MTKKYPRKQKWILTPSVAFGLCLALTCGASFFSYYSARVENSGRFDRALSTFVSTLRARMIVYTNALTYTRNLFHVKQDLSAQDFETFVSEMGLRENFSGIQTLGYVERMSYRRARQLLKSMNLPLSESLIDSKREEVDMIRFAVRLHSSSVAVPGVDVGASAERKEAMSCENVAEKACAGRLDPLF